MPNSDYFLGAAAVGGTANDTDTFTMSHTLADGTNRMLLLSLSTRDVATSSNQIPDSITYGSDLTPFSLLHSVQTGFNTSLSVWGIAGSDIGYSAGAHNVVTTHSTNIATQSLVVQTLQNVSQSLPVASDFTVDCHAIATNASGAIFLYDWNQPTSDYFLFGSYTIEAGSDSYTVTTDHTIAGAGADGLYNSVASFGGLALTSDTQATLTPPWDLISRYMASGCHIPVIYPGSDVTETTLNAVLFSIGI